MNENTNFGSQDLRVSSLAETAIGYWKKALGVQALFSVLYFGLFMVFVVGLYQYFGMEQEVFRIQKLISQGKTSQLQGVIQELAQQPNVQYFSLSIVFVKALLFPLNLGFYKIYQKMDMGQPYQVSDLLLGYQGLVFLKFFGYALFWNIIYTYLGIFNIIWVWATLLVTPIMYFSNLNLLQSIRLSIRLSAKNFIKVLAAMCIAFVGSYLGLLGFGVLYILTFPFWNAMIYTLYTRLVADQHYKN